MSSPRGSINDITTAEDESLILRSSEVEDTKEWIKTRYVMSFLAFLGLANVYAMRVNLSVAIVTMVNNTAITPLEKNISDVCPITVIGNATESLPDGEFVWNEYVQGLILGSFFYGYILTQVPGGRLAEIYGGKVVFGLGVLVTGILTAISPFAAEAGTWIFVAVRVLEGLGEGVTFPALQVLIARWIPPLERSRFAAYVYAGTNLGTIISMPLSGYLCSLTYLGGWPLSFYLFGGLGIVWYAAWWLLVYDTPSKHPRITAEEKHFIIVNVGEHHLGPKVKTPWKAIFMCVPMWAILVSQFGQAWSFYTLLTELPTYMKNIVHFDITQNSVLSTLPYMTAWLFGLFFSHLADKLVEKQYLSQLASYRIFNSIASIAPSAAFIAIAYLGCNHKTMIVLLGITGGFSGAAYAGNQMNHLALSPQFAGTMYGITNGAANSCGFFAPYVIGALINGEDTIAQWQIVFFIAAALNLLGNLVYVLFSSATEQPWSKQAEQIQDSQENKIEDEIS